MIILAVILVTVTSVLFSSPVQGACPNGWQQFNESCYSFVQRERTWAAALVDCIKHGSRLVKVDTNEENEFIRNYLISNARYFYGFDMWMGGRDDTRGNWGWSDGTVILPDDFEDWQEHRPPSGPQPNMCMEFESDFTYHWNQDFCDDLSYSICERPFEPLTPPPPTTSRNTTTADEAVVG